MTVTRVHPFAQTPDDCDRLFANYVRNGDLDGLLALYLPNAALIERDGTVRSGHERIGRILVGLTAVPTTIDMHMVRVHEANGVAVVHNDWQLRTATSDGASVERSGHAIEIVQRQLDGRWLFAIDDPFGRDRACR